MQQCVLKCIAANLLTYCHHIGMFDCRNCPLLCKNNVGYDVMLYVCTIYLLLEVFATDQIITIPNIGIHNTRLLLPRCTVLYKSYQVIWKEIF